MTISSSAIAAAPVAGAGTTTRFPVARGCDCFYGDLARVSHQAGLPWRMAVESGMVVPWAMSMATGIALPYAVRVETGASEKYGNEPVVASWTLPIYETIAGQFESSWSLRAGLVASVAAPYGNVSIAVGTTFPYGNEPIICSWSLPIYYTVATGLESSWSLRQAVTAEMSERYGGLAVVIKESPQEYGSLPVIAAGITFPYGNEPVVASWTLPIYGTVTTGLSESWAIRHAVASGMAESYGNWIATTALASPYDDAARVQAAWSDSYGNNERFAQCILPYAEAPAVVMASWALPIHFTVAGEIEAGWSLRELVAAQAGMGWAFTHPIDDQREFPYDLLPRNPVIQAVSSTWDLATDRPPLWAAGGVRASHRGVFL